jgi:hypothetical protein
MEEKNLRIKVTIGDFTLEIEGSADKVVEQFTELKKNGLDKLESYSSKEPRIDSPGIEKGTVPPSPKKPADQAHTAAGNDKFPTLRDVALKQLPGPESEWILVYGFYSSSFGKMEFTRNDIISKYEETNRKTDNRINNLSNNLRIAVNKDWINSLNDKDFVLSDDGKKAAKEILSRGTSSKSKKTIKRKVKASNSE